jgi:uncharacterized protein YndB with AHSA1/START domain
MSITKVDKNVDNLTMTITTEFDAPAPRVWQLWADPRQLERWWGPPTYPATVVQHDLVRGGKVTYFMTGPEGDQSRGWWRVKAVEAPHRLEFEDGFAKDDGTPNPDMPTMTSRVSIEEQPAGHTRMVIETSFPSREAMDKLLAMGLEEGMAAAVGQMDALVGALH